MKFTLSWLSSILGLRGKRSADPHFYGYYGHPFGYLPFYPPVAPKIPVDGAVGIHPSGGGVAVGRTVWGAGK